MTPPLAAGALARIGAALAEAAAPPAFGADVPDLLARCAELAAALAAQPGAAWLVGCGPAAVLFLVCWRRERRGYASWYDASSAALGPTLAAGVLTDAVLLAAWLALVWHNWSPPRLLHWLFA